MKAIGISGSPNNNGTVDRLVQYILNSTNASDTEFASLKELQINPCQGCLSCVNTNRCVQDDDWTSIENKIKQAEAMVLGVPAYYGAAFGVNGITHNFLERWFALRHQGLKLNLKKVILAIATGEGHGEVAEKTLKTFFDMYHGIEVTDTVIASGITPCYVCGHGEHCPLSAFRQRYGDETSITEDFITPLQKQESVLEKAQRAGKKIC